MDNNEDTVDQQYQVPEESEHVKSMVGENASGSGNSGNDQNSDDEEDDDEIDLLHQVLNQHQTEVTDSDKEEILKLTEMEVKEKFCQVSIEIQQLATAYRLNYGVVDWEDLDPLEFPEAFQTLFEYYANFAKKAAEVARDISTVYHLFMKKYDARQLLIAWISSMRHNRQFLNLFLEALRNGGVEGPFVELQPISSLAPPA